MKTLKEKFDKEFLDEYSVTKTEVINIHPIKVKMLNFFSTEIDKVRNSTIDEALKIFDDCANYKLTCDEAIEKLKELKN